MYTTRLQENIGKILHGRYALVAAVGQGASGDVFLAQDLSLGRKVAIKLLHSSLAGDPFFLKRFQSEAKSAASLNHPSIMRVFDWGESDATPYLVLEYLSGGSLREYLNTGTLLSEAQAASLMLQVAQGLSYAHGRGYVHRDIKPANLLFDDEARIRIADFGLARALSEAAWTEPVGTLMGTARYASPEQALAKESDRTSDVYSLGLVIHEALLGTLPFTGDTTVALLMARIHSDVEVPLEAGSLQPIIESCLKLSSLERISSTDLVSNLERLVRKLDPPIPLSVSGPALLVTDDNGDLTEVAELALVSNGLVGASDGGAPKPTNSSNGTTLLDTKGTQLAVDALPLSAAPVKTSGATEVHSYKAKGKVTKAGDETPFIRRKSSIIGLVIIAILMILGALAAAGIPSKLASSLFSTKVPSVIDESLTQAKSKIIASHLKVGTVSKAYSSSVKQGLVVSETPKAGISLSKGKTVNLVISKGHAPVAVPSLVGLSESVAESKLKAIGLIPVLTKSYSETAPVGQVMSASPSSGTFNIGTKVTLTVSQGPAPRKVPNLVGESAQTAVSQLKALVLTPSETQAYSTTVKAGDVISQSQQAGSLVARGSTIDFVVSKGPQIVTVPNVIGDNLQQAESAIQAAGLSVGSVYSYFGSNTVVATSPSSGARVRAGSTVALVTG